MRIVFAGTPEYAVPSLKALASLAPEHRIVAVVTRAKEMFPDKPIALAAGGFHLRSTGEEDLRRIASELEALGVQKIGASHCSGADAVRIFREHWGEGFVSFDLGDSYQF